MTEIKDSYSTAGCKSRKYVITFSEKPSIDQLNDVQKQFNDAIKSGCVEISIDLKKVDYICSTSLAELVKMKKIANMKKMKLRLENLSHYVMEVFRTTRLLDYFRNEEESTD
jgi:anti-anti-sigma factor